MRLIILLLCLACLNSASAQGKLLIPYRSGKLWGYCDTAGKMLIPVQYQEANWFYLMIAKDGKSAFSCASVKKGNRYFYINTKAQKVTPAEADDQIGYFGKIDMGYYRSHIPSGGKSYNSDSGKYGFTTYDGIQLFPHIYNRVFWIQDGYGCFKKGNFMGVVDMQGNTVVPFAYQEEYDLILPPDSSGLMKIVLNANGAADSLRRTGYMSVNGHWILKPAFPVLDYIHTGPPIGETVTLVRLTYNQQTRTSRLDTIRKQVPQFSVKVSKGGAEGILRSDGKWEIPMGIYDIGAYPYPYVHLAQNGKELGWMNVVKNRRYWKD